LVDKESRSAEDSVFQLGMLLVKIASLKGMDSIYE
jgi:hypothetical protein